MAEPFYAVIIPLSGRPDQGLPGPQPQPPGFWGGVAPPYPDQGLPGRPPYPSQGPVRPGRPIDPGYGWGGGEHPGNRPPGSWPDYPSTGPVRPGRPVDPNWGIEEILPEGPPPAPAHPWVPPAGEELPPPPEAIADQVVLAVWRPDEQAWKVVVAQGPHPAPHG